VTRAWPAAICAAILAAPPAARAETTDAVRFDVAPYLVDATAGGATIAFRLDRPIAAEVRVVTGGAPLVFASPVARRDHTVVVRGLWPGRIYEYEVLAGGRAPGEGGAGGAGGGYRFHTSARPGESFTFAVYGDPRPGENLTRRHHRAILEQIKETEPAFCLVLGDMVDDGARREQWDEFLRVEADLRRSSVIYPVLGDNDHAGGAGLAVEVFRRPLTEPYAFSWGGVWFFGMNTWGAAGEQPAEELAAGSDQLAWLAKQLRRDDVRAAPFRVVFMHDPVVVSRGHPAPVLERHWAPVLAAGGVDLVFASAHHYERTRRDGVTYVASGGAGAELVWRDPDPSLPTQAEARRHHFCRVDVKAGALDRKSVV